jgi:hypothetical protein
VPSIRFQLDAPLARVEAHVRATYGTAARVVSVSEVRTGGVGGFFARRALDIVVDVPDAATAPAVQAHAAPASGSAAAPDSGGSRRGAPVAGLAGLLADADALDGVDAGAATLPADFGVLPEQPTRRSMRAAEAAARSQSAFPGAGAGVRTE